MSIEKKWSDLWQRGEKLSRGGQGQTYIASPLGNPAEKVVLKIPHNRRDRQSRARLAREVLSLKELKAAGAAVPDVLDDNASIWETSEAELYVVIEHIPGDTLKELVEARGKLSIDEAVGLILSIAETIELAHQRDVLHRDLKPNNVIVRSTAPAACVVIDLGLSFFAGMADVTETGERLKNEFLHLPEFNDPAGNKHDPRSDVASLCALLYYLISGHTPVVLRDGENRAPHHRPGHGIDVALGNPELQKLLTRLFDRGFEYNVNGRFQNVSEFEKAVREAVDPSTLALLREPKDFAHDLGNELIQRSRSFKAFTFRGPAESVLKRVIHLAHNQGSQLPHFLLQVSHGGATEKGLPAGIDDVGAQSVGIRLSLEVARITYYGQFTVGARGDNCVLIVKTESDQSPNQRGIEPAGFYGGSEASFGGGGVIRRPPKLPPVQDFTELLAFRPDSPPSDDEVRDATWRWINWAMSELAKHIK